MGEIIKLCLFLLSFAIQGSFSAPLLDDSNPDYSLPAIQSPADVSQKTQFSFKYKSAEIPAGTDLWLSHFGFLTIGDPTQPSGFYKNVQSAALPLNTKATLAVVPFLQYFVASDELPSVTMKWLAGSGDSILSEISKEISGQMLAGSFSGSSGFLVTWKLKYYSGNQPSAFGDNKFQVLVIADAGGEAYAVINYNSISYSNKDYAGQGWHSSQAGIFDGTRQTFTSILMGKNPAAVGQGRISITEGRYILKISGDSIQAEGCTDSLTDFVSLDFTPRAGPMMGGTTVTARGPLFRKSQRVECQFGDTKVAAEPLSKPFSCLIRCVSPILYERGLVPFSVLVEGATYEKLEDSYDVAFPGDGDYSVVTLVDEFEWNGLAPRQLLKMKWKPEAVGEDSAKVTIRLHGYTESTSTIPSWKDLAKLSNSVGNLGTYTFNWREVSCTGDCKDYFTGAVSVETVSSNGRLGSRKIWSAPFALGWYNQEALKKENNATDWKKDMCSEFYYSDVVDMSWRDDLLDCPCSIDEAVNDFGRWLPDPSCNINTGSQCVFHVGAQHCVRSVYPTSKGAGNQCCYDYKGVLMYSTDSFFGSTPDKSHSWGAAPYKSAGHVPVFSHWVDDVIPFFYCCVWDRKYCYIYMNQRATKGCTGSADNLPALGAVFGDPHVITFDGASFMLQNQGYYVLTQVDGPVKAAVTARFTQLKDSAPSMVVTGVIVTSSGSPNVEITLESDPKAPSSFTLLVGSTYQTIADNKQWMLDFTGLVVSGGLTKAGYNNTLPTLTLTYKSGLGISLTALERMLLNVRISVSPQAKGKVQGLLGNFNDDVDDDSVEESYLQTYYKDCAVTLFSDSMGCVGRLEKAVYTNLSDTDSWRGIFNVTVLTQLNKDLGDSSGLAAYDFIMTGSARVANESVAVATDLERIRERKANPVIVCEPPVQNGMWSVKDYTLGGVTEVSYCLPGYVAESANKTGVVQTLPYSYTCTSAGTWTPPVDIVCEFDEIPDEIIIPTTTSSTTVPTTSLPSTTKLTTPPPAPATTPTAAPTTRPSSTSTTSPPSGSDTNAGAIAGGLVAALVAIVVVVSIGCYMRRRRQGAAKDSGPGKDGDKFSNNPAYNASVYSVSTGYYADVPPPSTGKSYRHAVEGAPKETWQKKKSFLGEARTAEEKLMYELNSNGSMSASVVTASPIGV